MDMEYVSFSNINEKLIKKSTSGSNQWRCRSFDLARLMEAIIRGPIDQFVSQFMIRVTTRKCCGWRARKRIPNQANKAPKPNPKQPVKKRISSLS